MPRKPLTSIELFTGAGGLALGMTAAGLRHTLLLEYNRHACESLRKNASHFGDEACDIHQGDVRAFDFRPHAGIDVLAAGAPCQPFSIGGRHRAHRDERNLFPQVFRATRELHPRAVIVENVKGLLRPSLSSFVEYVTLQMAHPMIAPKNPLDEDAWLEHLPVLRKVHCDSTDKSDLQYVVQARLLNAANFGVPQRRERVFFVAVRKDVHHVWTPPIETHSAAALHLAKEVTGSYWQGHGQRHPLNLNHPAQDRWRRSAGQTDRWATVRDVLQGLPEPIALAESEGWPNHILQPGARSYPGHTGSPLDEPAKTLKAGVHGVPGGENMLRRSDGSVRYFTVREAARIQSFPDSYVFRGAWGEAMRQIGNAVPVKLAEVVTASVIDCLEGLPAPEPARHAQRQRGTPTALVQGELPGLAYSV